MKFLIGKLGKTISSEDDKIWEMISSIALEFPEHDFILGTKCTLKNVPGNIQCVFDSKSSLLETLRGQELYGVIVFFESLGKNKSNSNLIEFLNVSNVAYNLVLPKGVSLPNLKGLTNFPEEILTDQDSFIFMIKETPQNTTYHKIPMTKIHLWDPTEILDKVTAIYYVYHGWGL